MAENVIAISVGKDFKNSDEIKEILFNLEYDRLISLRSKIFEDLRLNWGIVVEQIDIDWKDTTGSTNIKTGPYGPFNADAPYFAAKKVVAEATSFIKVGGGDYNINKLAKQNDLILIEIEEEETSHASSKQYKF